MADARAGSTPSVTTTTTAREGAMGTKEIAEADALREHLDDLNESGITPTAVGIDALGRPFLITLVGPYADSEDVFFDSPWQRDVSYGRRVDGEWVPLRPRCDDCDAYAHAMSDLAFPVVVLHA